ncbi:hypothetical protein [Bradyrhizobium centrolobii]|uniref:hypothetical protein n=1 Tax=Bradyrhizobium centrolobii TaxID=1505087 RepID=UPI000AFA8F76|nr:hypothetical protein [Bradyrhizobium centrolobii]
MAAINPDSQSRLPASLHQTWGCRSGRIACLVFLTTVPENNNPLPVCLFRSYPERIREDVICFTKVWSALA